MAGNLRRRQTSAGGNAVTVQQILTVAGDTDRWRCDIATERTVQAGAGCALSYCRIYNMQVGLGNCCSSIRIGKRGKAKPPIVFLMPTAAPIVC